MRLIDADTLQKVLAERWYNSPLSITGVKVSVMIDEQQTVDAVPVIRCKDCKHYFLGFVSNYCERVLPVMVSEDDYCSYAERRLTIPTEIIDCVLGEDD